MPTSLAENCWIFDMDGTLTVPVHDFEAIRSDLGLPRGRPILEELASRPDHEAEALHRRLFEIERGLAEQAVAWPDVPVFLAGLLDAGVPLGILTRNSRDLAHITLKAAGLAEFFDPDLVLGREDAEPKPSPMGIEQILAAWSVEAARCSMVGDYLFDLQAGRAAGCRTVLVDREGHGRWREWADVVVGDFGGLT